MNQVTNRFSWKSLGVIVAVGVLIAFALESREPTQVHAQTLKTGPAIGEKIPAFELPDHTGKTQTFESLRGPKGLLLLFHRSADW